MAQLQLKAICLMAHMRVCNIETQDTKIPLTLLQPILYPNILKPIKIEDPNGKLYPERFANHEGFTFSTACLGRALLEHPVYPRVPYGYTGGTPGAYRLILAYNDPRNQAMYVLIQLFDTKLQLNNIIRQILWSGCASPSKRERFCQVSVSGMMRYSFSRRKPS